MNFTPKNKKHLGPHKSLSWWINGWPFFFCSWCCEFFMFKLHSLFESFAMCMIILSGWFLQLYLMHNIYKNSMIYISWTFDSFVLTIRKSSNEILGIMKSLPNLLIVSWFVLCVLWKKVYWIFVARFNSFRLGVELFWFITRFQYHQNLI